MYISTRVADVGVPESKRRSMRLKAARGRFDQDVKRMSEGKDILMLDRLGKEGYIVLFVNGFLHFCSAPLYCRVAFSIAMCLT